MACSYEYNGKWYTEIELREFFSKHPELHSKVDRLSSFPEAELTLTENAKDNLISNWASEEGVYNQKEGAEGSKASPKTVKKVKEWLNRIGVDIQSLSNKKGVNAVANMLENIMQLAEGKEDVAITEEAFHFAVDIIEQTNPSLFKEMMNQIGKYNIYQSVKELYKEDGEYQHPDGSLNIIKLKKEAIGKLLSEMYIQSEQGLTEHPELLQKAKTWWERILAFFGILNKKAGFNPFEKAVESFEDLTDNGTPVKILAQKIIDSLTENNTYKEAAKEMMKDGQYSGIVQAFYDQLTDDTEIGASSYDQALKMLGGNEELARQIIALGSPYYQLSTEQKEKQQEIASRFEKKISDFQVEKITGKAEFDEQDDINFYQRIKDGKTGQVDKRVTDVVKEHKRPDVLAKFENATPIQKNTYKQKAAYGTQFHADAENIIKASLTPEGYLKPFDEIDVSGVTPNMPEAAFYALQKYLMGYNENGEYIPGILQTQFPEGTLFKAEQIVYDERKGRDEAGTIDLIGITPEGKIMIYDWKTKFLNTQQYSDIPFFSQQDYKIQLSEYKRILTSYNIKAEDVIVAQAMPIVFSGGVDKQTGDVQLTSVSLPEVDLKQETHRYLLPVPIEEQSSGNPKIDEYVRALEKLHQTLYKQKDLNKVLKIEQLNAISGAIRELQIKQEFGPLAEQGLIFLKGAERLLQDVNTYLKNDKGEYIAIEDKDALEEYRARIKNINDNIFKYQNTYALFTEIYGEDDLLDKDKQTLKRLEQLALGSSKMAGKIETEYKNFIAHYYGSKEGLNLLKTEKPVRGVFNRSIQTLSRMQNVALQYLRTVTARAKFYAQKKAIAKQREFQKILNAFKQLASSKGLPPREYFTLIAGKNKKGQPMNQLLKKIKAEFYDKFEEMAAENKADVEWLKENINLEEWQKAKDTDIEQFNKQVDDSIYVIGDSDEDNKEKTRRKEDYKAKFDISKDSGFGWLRPDMKFFIKDEDKWETEEYKKMSRDEAALDMYNFIINFNKEAKAIGYHDATYKFSQRFLPWLRASTLDRIKTSGLSAIGDNFKSLYTLTPEEEISHARVDPNTGQIEQNIPAFFTKNFAPEIRDEEGNFEGYDLSDVSMDIGETIAMYIEAVYEYESLEDVEGAVQSVRDIENAKKAYLLDSKGRVVHEKGTNTIKLADNNAENVALYDSFVEAILYKKQYSDKSNLFIGVIKLIERANQYFRLKIFGLNIFTPATIFIGGNFQGLINSRKMYKGKEFLKNELKIIGNFFKNKEGDIEKGLMDYFLPFTENRAKLKAERMSLEKIQRFSFSDFVMAPIRKTDILIQMAASLSILDNTILIDGELHNAREYILNSKKYRDRYNNGKLKEVEKGYEVKVQELIAKYGIRKFAKFNEKGFLEIEGIKETDPTVQKLHLKILNELRTITGNMSEEDKIDADRNIIGRSMMMFKRWIAPLATKRFGGLQKIVDIDEYEMGRVRMIWNIIFNGDGGRIKGLLKGYSTLRNMVAGNTEGIKALEEYYQRTAQTYKNRTGNDLEMSPEEFYDMTRRAIMQQAKEIGILLTMLSGLLALRWSGAPDDDKKKNWYRTIVRMLDKLTDEISFYYNPISLQQISTGSYIPSLGLLTDGLKLAGSLVKQGVGVAFGNEYLQKTAHPIKNFTSLVPMVNQVFRTFVPLIDGDVAKDLNISISAESRRQ